jgi:hypothetical protein
VPAAARPLLQAARHFSRSTPGHLAAGRLFPAPFSNERIGAAAANCKVPLPAQPSLTAMWQIRVTCTRVEHFGTRFDAGFADDQGFDPGPRRGPGSPGKFGRISLNCGNTVSVMRACGCLGGQRVLPSAA